MDTSETYIKMCEKAAEIQVNIIKPTIITFFDEREHRVPLRMGCDGSFFWAEREVWLPRQDQLQGMASSRPTPHSLAYTFGFFCEPIRCYRLHGTWVDNEDGGGIAQERELTNQPELEYPERFTSMEQLWLAFVMEKRYSKHWNGDDWIKVS